jgi:hypothetical protein
MTASGTDGASVPLIPRKILFDNPKQTAVKVSPGKPKAARAVRL